VIQIIVADDHEVVRGGFATMLGTQPDFTVVGTAADGAEAVRVCAEAKPDVVLMDVRMPVMDGIEATRQITAGPGDVRTLILTTFDLDEYVYAALRAGASGFMLKDTVPADLLAAIRVVAAGDALLAPSITRRLIGEFARLPAGLPEGARTGSAGPQSGALNGLTEREVEVLTLVARGMSNGEIADELVISPATAKTHVAHLLAKLGARDRVQLVIMGYQSGVVKVG
jgi:DNA-binding NarL/FixJ family response regulator